MANKRVVTVSRVELVRQLRAGRAAALAGLLVTECPWSPNGDGDERLRAAAWVRGYARGKRAEG